MRKDKNETDEFLTGRNRANSSYEATRFCCEVIKIWCLVHRKGWESAVGLEVHAQIDTKTKIFSRAPVSYGAPVNTQVDIFDAAIPGTLPVKF